MVSILGSNPVFFIVWYILLIKNNTRDHELFVEAKTFRHFFEVSLLFFWDEFS
jgi:hypothetical protein